MSSSYRPASKRAAFHRAMVVIPTLIGMTAVALVACGGGGDTGASPDPVATTVPAKLDAGNYKDASSTVAKASFGLADEDLASLAKGNAIGGGNKASSSVTLAAGAALKAFGAARSAAKASPVFAGTSQQRVNCTGGGTVTFDVSFNTANVDSVGDRVTITYDNCIDVQGGSETDGRLDMVLTRAGLGDFFVDPAYDVRLTYTFTQLRSVDSKGTSISDGSIELESVRSAVRTGYDSIVSPRLETSFTPIGIAATPATRSAVRQFAARNDYTTTNTTTRLDGTVTGSDGLNDGSVTVVTVTPFVRAIGRYPAVGVLTATGDQGSQLKMEAVNDTTVRLSVDSNGDGTYESVEEVPWTTVW
jgi:hypothetical protein